MFLVNKAMSLAVKLFPFLLEHLVANLNVLFKSFRVKVSLTRRARCQIKLTHLRESIRSKVWPEFASTILYCRNNLSIDIILVAVNLWLARLVLLLVSSCTVIPSFVSSLLQTLWRRIVVVWLLLVASILFAVASTIDIVGRLDLPWRAFSPLWLVFRFFWLLIFLRLLGPCRYMVRTGTLLWGDFLILTIILWRVVSSTTIIHHLCRPFVARLLHSRMAWRLTWRRLLVRRNMILACISILSIAPLVALHCWTHWYSTAWCLHIVGIKWFTIVWICISSWFFATSTHLKVIWPSIIIFVFAKAGWLTSLEATAASAIVTTITVKTLTHAIIRWSSPDRTATTHYIRGNALPLG